MPELARVSRLEFPKADGLCGWDHESPSVLVGKIQAKREVPTLESGQPLMPLISRIKGKDGSSAFSTGTPASRSEGLESGGILNGGASSRDSRENLFSTLFLLSWLFATLSESEVGEGSPLSGKGAWMAGNCSHCCLKCPWSWCSKREGEEKKRNI